MGRRPYSDIMRADELKLAKDAYDTWLKKSKAEKTAAYQATVGKTGNKRSNVGKQEGYLTPFGIDSSKNIYIRAKLLAPATSTPTVGQEPATGEITSLTTAVIGAEKYSTLIAPASGTIIRVRNSELAKVKYVEVGSSIPGLISRITGRPYTYRRSNSVSTPFGQGLGGKTALDTYEEVVADIKKNTTISGGDKKLYFTRQGNIEIDFIAP